MPKPSKGGLDVRVISEPTVVPSVALDYSKAVACDTAQGYRAVGGGGTIDRPQSGVILESRPDTVGGVESGGWYVRYRAMDDGFAGATITAWVVCARST
jgi:hypothetical protein